VVWILCGVIIGFVTSVAIAWSFLVHIVFVARFACDRGVRSHEFEVTAVFKASAMPVGISGFMTGVAISRESGSNVVGIARAFVIGSMATVTIAGCSFKYVVLVARFTGKCRVISDQLEIAIMVKGGAAPIRIGCFMTRFAGYGKSR
jgi:hypothetical protein